MLDKKQVDFHLADCSVCGSSWQPCRTRPQLLGSSATGLTPSPLRHVVTSFFDLVSSVLGGWCSVKRSCHEQTDLNRNILCNF